MDKFFDNILQKLFFEKEPQRVGLSQFKPETKKSIVIPPAPKKDIKLSDLMRRS